MLSIPRAKSRITLFLCFLSYLTKESLQNFPPLTSPAYGRSASIFLDVNSESNVVDEHELRCMGRVMGNGLVEHDFGIVKPSKYSSNGRDRLDQEKPGLREIQEYPHRSDSLTVYHNNEAHGISYMMQDSEAASRPTFTNHIPMSPWITQCRKRNIENLLDKLEGAFLLIIDHREPVKHSSDDIPNPENGLVSTELVMWPKEKPLSTFESSHSSMGTAQDHETQTVERSFPNRFSEFISSIQSKWNLGSQAYMSPFQVENLGPQQTHEPQLYQSFLAQRDSQVQSQPASSRNMGETSTTSYFQPTKESILLPETVELPVGQSTTSTSFTPLKGTHKIAPQPKTYSKPQDKLILRKKQTRSRSKNKVEDGKMNSENKTRTSKNSQKFIQKSITANDDTFLCDPRKKRQLSLKKVTWVFNRRSSFSNELDRLKEGLKKYSQVSMKNITTLLNRLWRIQAVVAKHIERPEITLDFQVIGFEFCASLITSPSFQISAPTRLKKKMPNQYYKLFSFIHADNPPYLLADKVLLEVMYGSLKYWDKKRGKKYFPRSDKENLIQAVSKNFFVPEQFRIRLAPKTLKLSEKTWHFGGNFNSEGISKSSTCTSEIWEQELNRLQNSMQSWNTTERDQVNKLFMELWFSGGAVAECLKMPTKASELRITAFEFLASHLYMDKSDSAEKDDVYHSPKSNIRNEYYKLGLYVHRVVKDKIASQVVQDVVYGALVYWGKEKGQEKVVHTKGTAIRDHIGHTSLINMNLQSHTDFRPLDLKAKTYIFGVDSGSLAGHDQGVLSRSIWNAELTSLETRLHLFPGETNVKVSNLFEGLWLGLEEAGKILNMSERVHDFRINGFEFLASLILSREFQKHGTPRLSSRFRLKHKNQYWKLLSYILGKVTKSKWTVLPEVIYGSLKYLERINGGTLGKIIVSLDGLVQWGVGHLHPAKVKPHSCTLESGCGVV
ncbi:hypothetical protein CROQUDRAFT_134798 [Cronartium quercuum f. sp. fusiforme G11]|uniref:Uncharacterized protein n=1 Tax=Cronartium quercuum f. sp. fusiforme G11 TaxID=708437 RepID=A0A9P6T931_9BASI|nr:hypothetical protein CROQUDRAFT_134798 [Cronartium quercuum f. sp. fusiforme G11]